ncbi:myosin II light chain [Coemansia sp. S610]|uniref:Myosin II light chain n=1 Tax=Coemansia spiralis TaxID=417178 RepID=A0A9W8L1N5_9FUNG|nr:myosin II light chain [Coemansia sp. RSA 2675]KAJ2029083.1 myosin II light chain [Coemansia sp. S610]KAJ2381425.1 myosin II light chain [Coemansia sp. RSA 2611]KAJ2415793.1 myosin II light chain [Coemansia sp. RSA 2530]KAJ2681834.1 myosin II light chain [Coemansia spiralis]KAJ2700355.1 myosin II light chain [Coemansia sp. IMI 209128]
MSSEKPTAEQLNEFKEAFGLFDRTGGGKIPQSSLGTLLRALGQNPTEAEVSDLMGPDDELNDAGISFDEFVKLAMRPGGFSSANSESSFNEFVQAFQVFDREGNGFISAGELRYVLTSLGEALTDAEVDELLKGFPMDKHGNINYEQFVRTLTEA